MKTKVLALTSALLLASGLAASASAQTYYYDRGTTYSTYGDVDRDGVPNRYDRYDNRYEYDRWGHRILSSDRDCDGVVDRYDPYAPDRRDADCDGVSNRYDNYYNNRAYSYSAPRRYSGSRYVAPYGYRGSRWSVGGYLPSGYYSQSYYIDYAPYGLQRPPYGYRWNRVGNDVYLVSTRNGLIAQVVYDLFH